MAPIAEEPVDLLVVCALEDELSPYLKLTDLGIRAEQTVRDVICGQSAVRFSLSDTVTGQSYRLVAAVAGMGPIESAIKTMLLISTLRPGAVAMTGVCAGNPSNTRKGDLVVANATWDFGAGKRIIDGNDEGQGRFQANIRVCETSPRLIQLLTEHAKAFSSKHLPYLEKHKPSSAILKVTYGDNRHEGPSRIVFGDYVTVADVTVDPGVFSNARTYRRNTVALDMESLSVAAAANTSEIPWLIVKGVQDHAQHETAADGRLIEKNDGFRQSAAISSRTFLLTFAVAWLKTIRPLFTIGEGSSPIQTQVDSTSLLSSIGIDRALTYLRSKLLADFELSTVKRAMDISRHTEIARDRLEDARLIRVDDARLGRIELASPAITYTGQIPSDTLTVLKEQLVRILVSCSAIYPAPIAVWRSLARRHSLAIEVDCSMINSIDVVLMLNRGAEFDFIVAAEDPFFIIGGNGTFRFRRTFPLLRSRQYIFQRKGSDSRRRRKIMYVVPGSSGYTQLEIGKGVPSRPQLRQIDALDIYQRAINLDLGEQIPIWDPIARRLELEPHLEKVTDSEFNIYVSLFAKVDPWYSSPAASRLRIALTEAFVAEWNWCSRNLDYCASLLAEDPALIDSFLIGSGISWE